MELFRYHGPFRVVRYFEIPAYPHRRVRDAAQRPDLVADFGHPLHKPLAQLTGCSRCRELRPDDTCEGEVAVNVASSCVATVQ